MTEPMVDDALVEKVARAMYEAHVARNKPWAVESLFQRQRWLASARAAIAIAYPAGVAAGREEAAKVVETWDKIGWSRMDLIDLRMHLASAIRQRWE